jgi:predicted benzoate:H+ symporter BenE
VTVAISLVTTILILAGGVWLLYTYVPAEIFNIIMAVLLADILLGITLRYLVLRRKRRKLSGQ